MKKAKKIISILIILQVMLVLLFSQSNVYATTITKDTIKTNLTKYITGEKITKATLSNGEEVTVGNTDATNDPITLDVTDTKMTLSDSTGSIEILYEIENNKCSFHIYREIPSTVTADEFYLSLMAPDLLSTCFLAVTDSYNVDSSKALKYYENERLKHKSSMDDMDTTDIDYIKFAKATFNAQGPVENDVFNYKIESGEEIGTNLLHYEADLAINLDKVEEINTLLPDEKVDDTNSVKNIITNDGKDDTTVKDKTLPQTGSTILFGAVALFFIIRFIVISKKNKDLKDVK